MSLPAPSLFKFIKYRSYCFYWMAPKSCSSLFLCLFVIGSSRIEKKKESDQDEGGNIKSDLNKLEKFANVYALFLCLSACLSKLAYQRFTQFWLQRNMPLQIEGNSWIKYTELQLETSNQTNLQFLVLQLVKSQSNITLISFFFMNFFFCKKHFYQ